MTYTQLTQEQRYQIYALKKMGHDQSQIAKCLGVHKSTISREYGPAFMIEAVDAQSFL